MQLRRLAGQVDLLILPHTPEALAQPPGGSAGSAEQMYSFQMAALRWFGVEKEGQEVGGAGLLIVEEMRPRGKSAWDCTAGGL